MTLVAAASRSATECFLGKREGQGVPVLWSTESGTGHINVHESPARVLLSLESHGTQSETTWPWADRGWTMQEELLSNRILYYTSSQMTWRCHEEQKWECGATKSFRDDLHMASKYCEDVEFGSGWLQMQDLFTHFKRLSEYLPRGLTYPLVSPRESFHLWYRLVQEYSPRVFTDESKDRLLGISGLARSFANMTQNQGYVAGLWRNDLLRGLTWYTEDAKLLPRTPPNSAFPSWSWASVGGSVVKTSLRDDFSSLSSINDVELHLVDPANPFSSVLSGTITMTGPLKRFPNLYHKNCQCVETSATRLGRDLSLLIERERPDIVKSRCITSRGGHFAAIQVLRRHESMELLILEAQENVRNNIRVYRRVGLHTVWLCRKISASPTLLTKLKELDTSLSATLGPPQKQRKSLGTSKELVEELRNEPWARETITIV